MKPGPVRHAPRRHLAFDTLRLEGGLFLPDQIEQAALGTAASQTEADYRIPKGLKLQDEYSRAFQVAGAQYKAFAAQFERGDVDAAASLDNAHLLAALQHLRWSSQSQSGSLAPVDYRNMGPEELGSVYESLLEPVPDIDLSARRFGFIVLGGREGSTAGNARKLTGSHYTPDALVQQLIHSALDPVIEQRLAARPAQPVEALLAVRVIDPACGSGHFLLAAARRLAEKLATATPVSPSPRAAAWTRRKGRNAWPTRAGRAAG